MHQRVNTTKVGLRVDKTKSRHNIGFKQQRLEKAKGWSKKKLTQKKVDKTKKR